MAWQGVKLQLLGDDMMRAAKFFTKNFLQHDKKA
jgi:hypothetical protein